MVCAVCDRQVARWNVDIYGWDVDGIAEVQIRKTGSRFGRFGFACGNVGVCVESFIMHVNGKMRVLCKK